MKLSWLPVSQFSDLLNGTLSFEEFICMAKELGLDSVDISIIMVHNHTPVEINRIKKILRDNHFSIAMATTYPDFTHPDEIQRERELVYLCRDIALCSNLGIRYLRVLAGQAHPVVTVDEGIAWAVDYLKRAVPIGEKYGVTLLYEDHAKPGAWKYIDFSHPTDIFLRICERLKGSGVRLNFDTGNIVAFGDDPIPILKQVIADVETIHVSDMTIYGEFSPAVIGKGVVPNKELFKILKNHEFDGLLSIEEASNTGMQGIREAVNFVRTVWNEV